MLNMFRVYFSICKIDVFVKKHVSCSVITTEIVVQNILSSLFCHVLVVIDCIVKLCALLNFA